MFWNWFFMILYSIGTCCSIATMATVERLGEKIFRMFLSTFLLIMAILFGNTIIIEALGI